MSEPSLKEYFERLRNSDVSHIGLGDIRLTKAMQDDLVEIYDVRECVIPGCTNKSNQGDFVGDKCSPCNMMDKHSQAYRNEHECECGDESCPECSDVCKCGVHECPDAHDGIITSIEFHGNYAKKETLMALHAEQAFKLLDISSKILGILEKDYENQIKSVLKEDIDNLLYKVGYNEN
jgi:hypothetical protein